MDFSEIQSNTWVFSLSSIMLVLIGWKVVYHNAKKIATRSESKALIDHLLKLSNESAEIAVKFWASNDEKDELEHTMASRAFTIAFGAKMSQTLNFIAILKRRDIHIDYILAANFQNDATLDVEKKASMSPEARHEKCQFTVDSSMIFIEHIYTMFENTHPPYSKNKYSPYYLEHFDSYCHHCSKQYL
ncbi:hypothetical protein PZA20_11945 [Pectobacterium polaris]|uniref:hypothetical protein n=1 Tax=Pectobacterium polaris TaxID=2042057 RepID=UPI0023AF7A27|nr:hypothetical protein [Pectobacterium polaris]MDE8742533.1 hypothetical protein [Pectobacterium polaris]